MNSRAVAMVHFYDAGPCISQCLTTDTTLQVERATKSSEQPRVFLLEVDKNVEWL